jgi:hypothetical protein
MTGFLSSYASFTRIPLPYVDPSPRGLEDYAWLLMLMPITARLRLHLTGGSESGMSVPVRVQFWLRINFG